MVDKELLETGPGSTVCSSGPERDMCSARQTLRAMGLISDRACAMLLTEGGLHTYLALSFDASQPCCVLLTAFLGD